MAFNITKPVVPTHNSPPPQLLVKVGKFLTNKIYTTLIGITTFDLQLTQKSLTRSVCCYISLDGVLYLIKSLRPLMSRLWGQWGEVCFMLVSTPNAIRLIFTYNDFESTRLLYNSFAKQLLLWKISTGLNFIDTDLKFKIQCIATVYRYLYIHTYIVLHTYIHTYVHTLQLYILDLYQGMNI